MKNCKILLKFRKDILALNYENGKMTLADLAEWALVWCKEKGVPEALHYEFHELAFAYASLICCEACIAENFC